MNYKPGEVILFKTEHKSFSWNNGLFIVLKDKDKTLTMCKLDKEGSPELFDDGRFMTTCTGSNNNPNIIRTYLSYKLPKVIKM